MRIFGGVPMRAWKYNPSFVIIYHIRLVVGDEITLSFDPVEKL